MAAKQMKFLLFFLLFSSATSSFSQEEFDQEFDIEMQDIKAPEQEVIEDSFNFEDSFSESDSSFAPTDEPEKLKPVRRNSFTESEKQTTTKDGRYIYHPNQDKGLFKINKNDEYLYRYEKTKLNGFLHLKFGSYNFENFPSDVPGVQFVDFYDSNSAFTFLLEYDWPIFKKMQSLSLNFSGGFSYNRGRGQFVDTSIATPVQERYTLWFLPMGLGLTYKLKFISNQIFLPYVNGSLNYNLLLEYREGFEAFKYLGIFGAHFAGGVSINLGWFERLTALQLDQEFGINNVYLTLEGRQVVSFEEDNDITGFVFLGGLSFEY
jgi:hypothetical protein